MATRPGRSSPGLRWLAAATLAAFAPAVPGQKLQLRQATALRELPSPSAPAVRTLPAQTIVEGTGVRSGAWVQILLPEGEPPSRHWIYLFDAQPLPQAAAATTTAPQHAPAGLGSVLRGIGQLFQAPPGTTTVPTATVGIRGLGQEDLRQAPPNVQALQTLQQQRASEEAVSQLARERGWQVRPAPILQPPVTLPPSTKESLTP